MPYQLIWQKKQAVRRTYICAYIYNCIKNITYQKNKESNRVLKFLNTKKGCLSWPSKTIWVTEQ